MLGKGTRGNIADNHFQRNDTDLCRTGLAADQSNAIQPLKYLT
jgi:hypothetical protein